jgi:hypothetical protein
MSKAPLFCCLCVVMPCVIRQVRCTSTRSCWGVKQQWKQRQVPFSTNYFCACFCCGGCFSPTVRVMVFSSLWVNLDGGHPLVGGIEWTRRINVPYWLVILVENKILSPNIKDSVSYRGHILECLSWVLVIVLQDELLKGEVKYHGSAHQGLGSVCYSLQQPTCYCSDNYCSTTWVRSVFSI